MDKCSLRIFSQILLFVQGSDLGPLLFNTFLCDLFLFLSNIDTASHEDDNTPYNMNRSTSKVPRDIKTASEKVFTWFQNNGMRANSNKFHHKFSDTGCQGNDFYIE